MSNSCATSACAQTTTSKCLERECGSKQTPCQDTYKPQKQSACSSSCKSVCGGSEQLDDRVDVDDDECCVTSESPCCKKMVICTKTSSPCPPSKAPAIDALDDCWKVQIICSENTRKRCASTKRSAAAASFIDEPPPAKQTLSPESRQYWMKCALVAVVLTFVINIVEGTVSLTYGSENVSISLIGFGSDSWIEVVSVIMVGWKIVIEWDDDGNKMIITWRERAISALIGSLLCFLALAVIVSSIYVLTVHETPESTVPSIIIAASSLFCMTLLYVFKVTVATALNSNSIASDAQCTASCIKLSTALLIGSIIYNSVSSLWWFDSATALFIALFIGWDGMEIIHNSMKVDFDGSCGCGGESDEKPSRMMTLIRERLIQYKFITYTADKCEKTNKSCCGSPGRSESPQSCCATTSCADTSPNSPVTTNPTKKCCDGDEQQCSSIKVDIQPMKAS